MSFSLDDLDKINDLGLKKKPVKFLGSLYDTLDIGSPISYDLQHNKFLPLSHEASSALPIGVSLSNNKDGHQLDVLYKGFLCKDPIEISASIKTYNIQAFILDQFNQYKRTLIDRMPRIKRLKRLNLKFLSKAQTQIIYNNFDTIMSGYESAFGYEYAMMFKASFISTPFYIQDNNIIKIYNFETNELTYPEFDGANFFCYFTYHY